MSVLFDFDRTLAHYESWEVNGSALGAPIEATLQTLKSHLSDGDDVRIFTARAAHTNPRRDRDIAAIKEWCLFHIGVELPVQNWKDFTTKLIYDDLAVSVEANTGRMLDANGRR